MNPAPRHDPESDIVAWAVGSGIFVIQLCAVVVGLLPSMLLLLPFVLPFAVLGLVGGLLVALPVGLWRLLTWTARPLVRRIRRITPTIPARLSGAGITQLAMRRGPLRGDRQPAPSASPHR